MSYLQTSKLIADLDDNFIDLTARQLSIFAKSDNFWNIFGKVFGTECNLNIVSTLQSQWQAGDLSQLPTIEIISSNILGQANGAYAIDPNKIYLSDTFVATATTAAVSAVLLEEIGHFVDARVNQIDQPGDEGELFAALVQGQSLTDRDLARISTENDAATISIDNKTIAVEQSTPSVPIFNVIFNDPTGTYAPYYTAIQSNIIAAGLNWNKYIQGSGSLDISVGFTLTGTSVATGGSSFVFPVNGLLNTVQSVASTKLRTGIDQNGAAADVNFNLNPIYLSGPQALWYDPDPVTRTTPIPIYQTDAVSVFIHEFGHALAFNGFKNNTTGVLTGSVQTTFDEKTSFDGTNFFFTGTRATAIYGGPVPLTFGSISHLGNNSPRPGSNLLSDVMAAVASFGRNYISTLDLAILADCGIPTGSTRNDFNNDKKSDILWRNTDGRVAIWQMDGNTILPASAIISTQTADWKIAGTGDFNNDQKSDILWRNNDGRVAIWQMDGNTILPASAIISTQTADWKIAGTGDFNNDQKSDILWRNNDGRVAIWQMDGNTILPASAIISTQTADWKIAGTGDFNGDSKSDILWRNDDGRVAIWQMDGNTITPASAVLSSIPTAAWQIAGTGDFNGDSKSDILWRNDDGRVAIWQMNGTTITPASAVLSSAPGADWKIAGTGDFNGDSKSDILWRNDLGSVAIWQMDGTTITPASAVLSSVPTTDWKIAAPIL
jgi:FG-GAP-like repeat